MKQRSEDWVKNETTEDFRKLDWNQGFSSGGAIYQYCQILTCVIRKMNKALDGHKKRNP